MSKSLQHDENGSIYINIETLTNCIAAASHVDSLTG